MCPPDISPSVYKPTQNPLRSCISPGLITGILRYFSAWLASGSEDEKRIRRAEQRALRKRSQRQHQKAKLTKQGLFQPQSSTTTTAFAGQPQPNSRSNSRSFGAFSKPRPGDICFACDQQGHCWSQCQVNLQARSSHSGPSFFSSGCPSVIWGKEEPTRKLATQGQVFCSLNYLSDMCPVPIWNF